MFNKVMEGVLRNSLRHCVNIISCVQKKKKDRREGELPVREDPGQVASEV